MSRRKSSVDNSRLNKIKEMESHHRKGLQLDNDYESSTLELAAVVNTDTVTPTTSKSSRSSSTSSVVGDEKSIKLVKRSTDEDIYQLKTNFRVDKRRFSQEGVPKSRFNDVKFTTVTSIIDRLANWDNQFAGFYVLFWLSVGVLVIKSFINYILEKGWKSELVNILLTDLFHIALTDLWMYLSIYFVFGLHYLIKLNYLTWEKSGWILSSVYEFAFLIYFTLYSEHMNFPWIGKIFLYLHSLVLLMKMHSFSFYNGYLWKIKNELEISRNLKLDEENFDTNTRKLIDDSISFCEFELNSRSTKTPFPSNINIQNFFLYTMFPTLVYEIEYPRTAKIRWGYVLEKLCAIFGVILLMIVIAQNMMYPIAIQAIALRELPLTERIKNYPLLLLNMTPSFLLIYLLDFYLIWDAILNCIAELTRFGDREFYGPWWNCVSWDQFSRLWNVPVHRFLLRHVYHSSISALHLSKTSATVFTFLLSAVVHEGAMFVLFHKFRGFLFVLQMFQLPLVAISKTKYLREKKTLGNVIFWFGIATGPSLMCTLYLTF